MKLTRFSAGQAIVATVVALIASVVMAPSPASAAASPQQAFDMLNRQVHLPGAAWALDSAADQVVISYDRTVTGARLARLTTVAERWGDAVRLEQLPGRLSVLISGGEAIFSSSGFRCTLGFNVRSGSGAEYFLTAGHCTNAASFWYADPGLTRCLGPTAGSSFPGNDFGAVRYTCDEPRPGNVYLYNGGHQDIASAGRAYGGQSVCMSGPVGGLRCGTVIAVNATVNYPQGTVYGMTRTNICAYPGESGAPLFAGAVALGTLSGGGSGGGGCTSYFQPVTETLNFYGMQVY